MNGNLIEKQRRSCAVRSMGRGPLRPALAVAALIFCSGCGGSYIRVKVARPDEFPQPVWVGVFFLSQESALDGVDTRELIDKPDSFTETAGVLDKEVFPVHSGEAPHVLVRDKYDPRIGWVLVAASFPKPEPCSRSKLVVKKKSELTLNVSVEEKCLKVTSKN